MSLKYKPGLVLNFRYNNFFSNTITMGMGHYFSHTAWIISVNEDNVLIQEARGSKEKKVVSNWYKKEYLNTMFRENNLKIMDFGIVNNDDFLKVVSELNGIPYDYFTIMELAFIRIRKLFGLKVKISDVTTPKKVDCSEAISRAINELTNINPLEVLKVSKYDLITPQMMSIMYDKLTIIKKLK